MKISYEPKGVNRKSIAMMTPGTYGVTDDGLYYYRTENSACCLNDYGKSYTGNANVVVTVNVLPLTRGTKITIEID